MKYRQLLDDYVKAVDSLESKVKGLSESALLHKPTDDAWSIKQHVVHIAETDINNYIRWRSVIGSPGSNVYVIDEDAWVKNLDYESEDIFRYLSVMKTLREMTRDYLSRQNESVFTEHYFVREYKGESKKFTIEMSLGFYNKHIETHFAYINRNITSAVS